MTEMAQQQDLKDALGRWTAGLRRRRALRRAWRVLWPGSALCAGAILAGTLIPAPLWLPWPPGALVLGAVALLGVAAAVWAALARAERREAAQIADLRLETRGLFVTAEDILARLEGGQAPRDAERACLEEAQQLLAQTRDAQAAAPGPGARLGLGLLPVAVAVAAVLAPWAVDATLLQEREDLKAAAEEIKKVEEKLLEEIKDPAQLLTPEQQRRLSRLRQRLRQGEITRREAAAELGELKRELRAQSQAQGQDPRKPSSGAEAAARELARSQQTQGLGRELGQTAQGAQGGDKKKPEGEEKLAEAARQLQKLDRAQQRQAAQQMRQAAQAARAQGDLSLAQALEQTAQALEDGDPQALEQAAQQLQRAAQSSPQGPSDPSQLTQEQMEQLAADLERIQQQLSQQGQGAGRMARNGEEGRIAPSPRNWQQGGGPGKGQGQGEGASAGAGKGHDPGEAPGFATGDHQDRDRFGDKESEPWEEVYQELHEAQLLNSDSRITTRVQGERGEDGKVLTMEGGQQAPRSEQARRALERLPVRYSEQAREDVGAEKVPPAYRDAVRDYFDTRK